MPKTNWNKSPLSCAHQNHCAGHKCQDCGARIAPRPQPMLVSASPTLTDDDYDFAGTVERDVLAARK